MDKPCQERRTSTRYTPADAKERKKLSRESQRTRTASKSAPERKCANYERESNSGGSSGFFRRTPEEVGKRLRFAYIKDHAKKSEIALHCRILGVTPQGYQKYLSHLTRPKKYAQLLADMRAIQKEDKFNKTYGKRRMFEKLQLDYNCPYCYNTVAKVMKENGLMQKPNHPKGLTKADKQAQKTENLLQQDFSANAPNQKTVTDITEFIGCDGKVYISAIFDCFDNACLAVSIADHMRKELVIETYKQAAGRYYLRGAIGHSDRGSQYTSTEFRETIKQLGIIQSMNSAAGRCHDNAKCESMWARGKSEIKACYDTKKMTCEEIKSLIFRYYLGYWNNRRICSAIGGIPPMVKRGAFYEKLADNAA